MNTATDSTNTLEILSRLPAATSTAHRTPLLFVHGAFVGAWCWEEHFLPWFAERGWASYALSLTGHGQSRGQSDLDNLSIDQYVADVVEVVATLPAPPVLIGHSMGGMVVQKYLEQTAVPAAVLMASVPPQGIIGSALGLLFTAPELLFDFNRAMSGNEPDADSLRQALFHQSVTTENLQRYWRLAQPESHRALWDMAFYNLPRPGRIYKSPMLVLGAQHDRLFPVGQVQMTGNAYKVRPEIFPGMGHAMMLERSWEKVALCIDRWLVEQGL